MKTNRRYWTDEENALLDKAYNGATVEELVAMFPGRSAWSIANHASRRGLKKTTTERGRAISAGRLRTDRALRDLRDSVDLALMHFDGGKENGVETGKTILRNALKASDVSK